ncbi:peptidase E [Pseudanabaenaceae cyanobacterium LEGE 13415]|nr:peptidase E [Pseudanabaenaceae cyanobacterium LEGE 13415]
MALKLIAIGGGGFLMEPENPLLDQYCLNCTGRTVPKVCFIPTASGDSESFLSRFYTAFSRYSCEPSHLAFFRCSRSGAIPLTDIEQHLLEQDLIYVGGGNTRAMLAIWREWGIAETLRKAWRSGVVLSGMSAGAICWFEYGGSDSNYIEKLSALKGLGFIQGSCTPHYDGELNRRPDFHQLIRNNELPPGIGIDDGAAVLFEGQQIVEVVASKPTAKAYRVKLGDDGQIAEESLETKYLC